MKIEIHEENHEPPTELQRTLKVILTQQEYDNLKTAFCKGKGWSLVHPHTVNVQSITLAWNYKWMPKSNVEFLVEIEGKKKDPITESQNRNNKTDMEKANLKAK